MFLPTDLLDLSLHSALSSLPPQDGFLLLDKAKFPAAFGGDVEPERAGFMADSQVPWGLDAVSATITCPSERERR
jgi:hypothetical protein